MPQSALPTAIERRVSYVGKRTIAAGVPVTILLVDDDDIDAIALERAFKTHGLSYPLVVAHDGLEALELLRDGTVRRPYLIMLDLNMPRVGGIEFLDELRSDPTHHSAVVFALTTSDNDHDRTASYDRNVAGYIVKSTLSGDLKELVTLLTNFCRIVMMP